MKHLCVEQAGGNKYIAIFSHHSIGTMDNAPVGSGRIRGDEVRDLLLRDPNVIMWVQRPHTPQSGTAHARPSGSPLAGGFWELNTAAHIDRPQHSRIVELVDNRDGTLSIFGTMVDHAGLASNGGSISGPLALSALDSSRCARPQGSRGGWAEQTINRLPIMCGREELADFRPARRAQLSPRMA